MENNIETPKSNNLMISAILIIVVIVAGVLLTKGSAPQKDSQVKVVGTSMGTTNTGGSNIKPVSADEHIAGNPKGSIVIVEYSDTECPFCKQFHNTMHQLIANNNDVMWVYRHFPIASLHPKAFNEAVATECAGEQGDNKLYWTYLDEVYKRTNSNNSLDPNELYKIASDLNLDTAAFTTCLESQKYADIIQASIEDAGANGAKGTPTSFIFKDGQFVQMIPGALPYQQLSNLINSL